jgi:hypothetical protein
MIHWPFNALLTVSSGALLLLAMGCATTGWESADCERKVLKGDPSMCATDECRRIMAGVNVLACNDEPLGRHCARGGRELAAPEVGSGKRAAFRRPVADNGKPVDYLPRACLDRRPTFFGRRPMLWIGRTYANCWLHELAHFLWPKDPAFVAAHFPCFGDNR